MATKKKTKKAVSKTATEIEKDRELSEVSAAYKNPSTTPINRIASEDTNAIKKAKDNFDIKNSVRDNPSIIFWRCVLN